MDFTELLKELTRDNQVYFLLHNQNLLNGCSGLPALMDKLLAQDPSWKNLKTELNISDAFVAENKSNIQKFIYEGGAEIMTSFLNRQPKKKEEIRRIVNAELLGKFMELKYHGGDLGREIAFPIKRDTEEIWKEKTAARGLWMGNLGRGQPASGHADRRSTAAQLYFLSEWSKL